HSPNIKERLDHSCALFDARGRLVAQAAHIPVHLGSLPRAVEAALALGPLAPGDVVLLNDPYAGGTHLPDLTLVSPVFLPGPRRLHDLARREAAGRGPGLARAAAALMDHAERRVRSALRGLPRGRYRFTDALDDDGLGRGPVPIAVTLTLAGDRVRADFTGSAAQTPGPVNAVAAVTRAATYYAVRCVLGG